MSFITPHFIVIKKVQFYLRLCGFTFTNTPDIFFYVSPYFPTLRISSPFVRQKLRRHSGCYLSVCSLIFVDALDVISIYAFKSLLPLGYYRRLSVYFLHCRRLLRIRPFDVSMWSITHSQELVVQENECGIQ